MMSLTARWSAAASILALALLSTPASAQYPASKVAKMFKKDANAALKAGKQSIANHGKNYCEMLSQLEQDIKDDLVDNAEVADLLLSSLSEHLEDLYNCAAITASDIGAAAESNLFVLDSGEALPKGYIAGDCSTLDAAGAKLAKDLTNATNKAVKKAKSFAKKQFKKNDLGMTVLVHAPTPPAVTPAPAPPADPPMKPLAVDSSAGSNEKGGDAGILCFTGSYDPRNGASVSVTIDVPTTGEATQSATVNPETCRWRVCFGLPGSSEGPLPPGTYLPTVCQIAGDEVSEMFEAPQSVAGGVPNP